MKSRAFAIAAASLALLFASGTASAQPAATEASVPQADVPAPQTQEPAHSSPFATATVVAEDELSLTRGGAGLTITAGDNATVAGSSQDATSTNNSVEGSVTGNSTVAGNAFQGSNGFVILNSNTGNNVAMNSSMNVNIIMPSPN